MMSCVCSESATGPAVIAAVADVDNLVWVGGPDCVDAADAADRAD